MQSNDALWKIFDQDQFFSKYKGYRHNPSSPNNLLEQPCIKGLLPDLTDKEVLDIGSGFGDLCRYVVEQGASRVLGIDPSEKMYHAATETIPGRQNLDYKNISIEDLKAKSGTFDLIVSSLALHYVDNLSKTFHKISNLLKPNGFLAFSINHPCYTAAMAPLVQETNIPDGNTWPGFQYRNEGYRQHRWLSEDVIKYHHTFETIMDCVLSAGIQITQIKELYLDGTYSDDQIEQVKDLSVPIFLVVSGSKI